MWFPLLSVALFVSGRGSWRRMPLLTLSVGGFISRNIPIEK